MDIKELISMVCLYIINILTNIINLLKVDSSEVTDTECEPEGLNSDSDEDSDEDYDPCEDSDTDEDCDKQILIEELADEILEQLTDNYPCFKKD